ncbi:exopolysaccharide biosynthesis protein [Actibacterium sp. D379-3]
MTDQAAPETISDVLDTLADVSTGERVSVREIVESMGERSFAPLLLVPAMVLVSPISSIPGMPTLGALVMSLIVVQILLGRDYLWLPEVLARRSLPSDRMERAVNWLRKPAAWIDRHAHQRLPYLTIRPLSYIALLTCLAVTLVMPLMEFVPALATVAAFAITLFAVGMLTRDGLFVIGGYSFVGLGGLLATVII